MSEGISQRRLYPKHESPQLPGSHTLYGAAKRLEFSGDLRSAFQLYHQALYYGDRPDSALKDISNIYVMFGRVQEAIAFLKENQGYVTNWKGYENLVERLGMELQHQQQEDHVSPRALLVEVHDEGAKLSFELCDRIFPNPGKIRRILFIDDKRGVVHFSTYSSARKALQIRKLTESINVSWALGPDQALMLDLETRETALDAECLNSRRLERLPDHLAAFDDDKSCVSLYNVSDPVVLAASESIAALESLEIKSCPQM